MEPQPLTEPELFTDPKLFTEPKHIMKSNPPTEPNHLTEPGPVTEAEPPQKPDSSEQAHSSKKKDNETASLRKAESHSIRQKMHEWRARRKDKAARRKEIKTEEAAASQNAMRWSPSLLFRRSPGNGLLSPSPFGDRNYMARTLGDKDKKDSKRNTPWDMTLEEEFTNG
ncbi:hypothetical protein PG995_012231 [Apiospora arundinis]